MGFQYYIQKLLWFEVLLVAYSKMLGELDVKVVNILLIHPCVPFCKIQGCWFRMSCWFQDPLPLKQSCVVSIVKTSNSMDIFDSGIGLGKIILSNHFKFQDESIDVELVRVQSGDSFTALDDHIVLNAFAFMIELRIVVHILCTCSNFSETCVIFGCPIRKSAHIMLSTGKVKMK